MGLLQTHPVVPSCQPTVQAPQRTAAHTSRGPAHPVAHHRVGHRFPPVNPLTCEWRPAQWRLRHWFRCPFAPGFSGVCTSPSSAKLYIESAKITPLMFGCNLTGGHENEHEFRSAT